MKKLYNLIGQPGVSGAIVKPYKPFIELKDVFTAAVKGRKTNPYEKNRIQGWDGQEKAWPEKAGFVLASMSTTKLKEGRRPLAFFDVTLKTANAFFGDTVPDSEEPEVNGFQISHGKIGMSVLDVWDELSESEKENSLQIMGTNSPKDIAVIAEDRNVDIDPIIREHPIFDDIRNSQDILVAEAFDKNHAFPGKRMKEVMKASGGAVSFLRRVEIAKEDLRKAGKTVSDQVTLGVSVVIKPLVADTNLPLPPEGIISYAQEEGAVFRAVTERDIADEKAGVDFDVDHFEIPYHMVLQGIDKTIAELREDEDNEYFQTGCALAVASSTAMRAMGAKKLNKPKSYHLIDLPEAKLADISQIGEMEPKPYLKSKKLAGYKRGNAFGKIHTLADVERFAYAAEGYVIGDKPDPRDFKDPLDRLTVKLERALMHDSLTALMPHGGFIATGRPLIVHQRAAREEFSHFGNFHNTGAVAHQHGDLVTLYHSDNSLEDVLAAGRWDPQTYKKNPAKAPDFKMLTQQELCDILGVKDIDAELGFRWAGLGTASAKIPKGLDDTERVAYLAARAGMTCFSGGGTREGMERFFAGSMQAYGEGFDRFTKVGIRVPVVSRAEGSDTPYFMQKNLAPSHGEFGDKYYRILDDRIHMLELAHMAERQHAVYVLAQESSYFMGGIGTSYEFHADALSNAYIERGREGMFLNNDKRPMFVMNSQISDGGKTYGYFDRYMSRFDAEELEIMKCQVFTDPDKLFEAKANYARSLGYDVADPNKTVVFIQNPTIYGMD
ncbi:MAG: hypothetical protein CMH27_04700 [Micavibrio sp.]|nr:hypothetical protein [Micavibrio sp.]|tara:strand:+ start:5185 stop:7521 length:2337 start_codon:yes stop_codon:yes gene_type:complete